MSAVAYPTVPAPFWWNATVISHHDGDTGLYRLDRGFHDYSDRDIRLLGGNAIELDDPGGQEAMQHLYEKLPPGTMVTLASAKPDKYGGRLDAQVFYLGAAHEVRDLTLDLVVDGWMAPWNGKGPKPVPTWPRVVTTATSFTPEYVRLRRATTAAVREWHQWRAAA